MKNWFNFRVMAPVDDIGGEGAGATSTNASGESEGTTVTLSVEELQAELKKEREEKAKIANKNKELLEEKKKLQDEKNQNLSEKKKKELQEAEESNNIAKINEILKRDIAEKEAAIKERDAKIAEREAADEDLREIALKNKILADIKKELGNVEFFDEEYAWSKLNKDLIAFEQDGLTLNKSGVKQAAKELLEKARHNIKTQVTSPNAEAAAGASPKEDKSPLKGTTLMIGEIARQVGASKPVEKTSFSSSPMADFMKEKTAKK